MNNISLLFFGIVVCFICVILKEIRSSYAWICALAGAVVIIIFSIGEIEKISSFLSDLQDKGNLPTEHRLVLFKILGVCILGDLSISVCQDQHYSSLANSLEFLCKCMVIVLSLPIFEDVLNVIGDLLV